MPNPLAVSQRPGTIAQKIGALVERIGVKISGGVTWVGTPDTSRIVSVGGEATPDAERLTLATAGLTSAYAFTALDWRASRVGEAPPMVARETKKGFEWVKDHPLTEFFEAPSLDLPMGELLAIAQRYRDVTGASIIVIDRDVSGRPVGAVPFSAWEFRVKQDKSAGRIFGTYEIKVGGSWKPVKREDVIHLRDVFGASWTQPTSRLEIALQNVNLGHTVTLMLRRYMQRAMFPGGVISPDPKWDPDPKTWNDFKDAIRAWHAGPAKAGEVLAVKGGTTFTRAALGMADLVPSEVLDRVEGAVGSIMGVPPIVLGWVLGLRNSPWSQAEQMESQAYSNTVVPIWKGIGDAMGRTLLTEDERRIGRLSIRFDTSEVRALQDDDEENARVAAMNARIWTLDESRIYTGMEPLGGEKGKTLVADLAFSAATAAGLNPGGDPPADDDDEEEEDEEGDDTADDEKTRRAISAKAAAKRKEHKAVWAEFDAGTKANEPTWEAAVYAELQTQRVEIVKLATTTLEQAKSAKSVDRDSATSFQLALGDLLKKARPRMKAIVEPLVLSTGGQAVRSLSARISVTFDLLQPGLNSYAARESAFVAEVMGETTGRLVIEAVQKGLSEGDTIGRMVERLNELPAFSTDRAKLVARTETTRAWNGAQRGSLSAYSKQSGRPAFKTWLSSQDDRVRDEHKILDGERRGIDEPFSNDLQAPGEPNCRCTLTYAVTDPIGG